MSRVTSITNPGKVACVGTIFFTWNYIPLHFETNKREMPKVTFHFSAQKKKKKDIYLSLEINRDFMTRKILGKKTQMIAFCFRNSYLVSLLY